MTKRSVEYYLLQGIVVVSIALIVLVSYAITDVLKEGKVKTKEETNYVSYEVLTDNVMPVMSEEIEQVNKQEEKEEEMDIVKPYTDESVTIGKSYYDYKAEENSQQNSIIYYENTYIQNTGIDYTAKKVFNVNSIADGKVISVTKDDIVGNTIKIQHNNLIAVYQSVNDIKVKADDQVVKGQEIATSGTNNISSDLGNHLHFELYKDNILVNPETFFNKEG